MTNKDDFQIAIDKETLASLPVLTYDGNISVLSTPEDAEVALIKIKQCGMVGFDTETKPSFKKGKMNEVALMQVATPDHAYLFRLNKIGIDPVKNFLEDESILKIGLSLRDDFQMLKRRGDFEPAGFIDLQTMVKDYHIKDISLQKIYGILFGYRISKSQRLSNWEAPTLTHGQQLYASIDAVACLRIYQRLVTDNFNPLDSPYLQYVPADSMSLTHSVKEA